ncbi:MAG: DUF1592 domain-containing protein [Myxococcota bacterium]|nr:DUF1592 domain-containing protein [Myxococcota bacterium]
MADLLLDTSDPGAAFPLDGPTGTGFEAPNSVADLNVQYYFQTADSVIASAVSSGNLFKNGNLPANCVAPTPSAEATCAGQFITALGLRAFRRPVATAEMMDLQTVFTTARGLGFNFNDSLGQVAKALIQSPNFLYHWEIGPTKPVLDPTTHLVPLTPWQIASRMALTLWETAPDDALLSAAQAGQLATPAAIQSQVQRMLADPRAAQALFNFHKQWLLQVNGHVTDVPLIVKSNPLFTPAAAQSLTDEFTKFLVSVYATGDGTLNTLFTAPYAFVNPALAPIYGVNVSGTGFTKVQLDPTQRAGILTQTAFLSAEADPSADNPVRRGLTVYLNVLCGQVRPPPPVVPPVGTPLPNQTTRQLFEVHAQAACAAGCHTAFDPPGFAFENYDAIGAFRTKESGQPVDATGTFTTPGGAALTFKNAVDLTKQLASSTEAQWCIDRQWFRYMLGRPEGATEQGSMEVAYHTAKANPGYSLRDMLGAMVTSKAFLYRAPSPGEPL